MDRNATAAFLAELAKQKSQPFHLFELVLDSETVRATDAPRDITWNGNTYLALSHFLEFGGVQETAELQVSTCQVTLSGVDQTLISLVLSEQYIDRRLVIYKGFLSEDLTGLLLTEGADFLTTEGGDILITEGV